MRIFLPILLVLALLIPGTSSAGDKIRGKYEVIGSLDKLKGAKQIEMIEFFNYSCGHCNRFLETSKRLRDKYKDKLHHKKVPIYWDNQPPYPAMAFYISDELGVEEKFTQALFDTHFKKQINIFQPRVINYLAKDFGVESEIKEGMQSPSIQSRVQKGKDLAEHYKVQETPTMIINKVLKVAPSIVGGNMDEVTDNLDLIFQDILGYN